MRNPWRGPETSPPGSVWDFGLSLADDGTTSALVRQSFQQPPESGRGRSGLEPGHPAERGAYAPPGASPRASTGRATACTVQGWLIYPGDYDPAQALPDGGVGARRARRRGKTRLAGGRSSTSPCFPRKAISSSSPIRAAVSARARPSRAANVKDFGYGDFAGHPRGRRRGGEDAAGR